MERGEYSALQKIEVTCNTCGVSDSFYSNLSVEHFKAMHKGHEVVGGAEHERPSERHDPEPVAMEEVSLMPEEGTKLSKLTVALVNFPALPRPLLRVEGFANGPESAFVITSSPEGDGKIRGILARGEYLDDAVSGRRYFWDPDAIEYGVNTRERLGLPHEAVREAKPAEPRPAPRAAIENLDQSTAAKTNEALFGSAQRAERDEMGKELRRVPPSLAPAARSPPESPTASSRVRRAEQRPEPKPIEVSTPQKPLSAKPIEVSTQPRPLPAKRVGKKRVPKVSGEAPRHPEEEKDDERLLVSKSWYIQGGTQNKKEAVRISKILQEFRWKVQPVYTIGVILDDILSIETSKNQISRKIIKRVEKAGYRLTSVSVDQGMPVAWFKKTESKTRPSRLARGRKEGELKDIGSSRIHDLETDFEPEEGGQSSSPNP